MYQKSWQVNRYLTIIEIEVRPSSKLQLDSLHYLEVICSLVYKVALVAKNAPLKDELKGNLARSFQFMTSTVKYV